ncbi:MAG: phenylalanine--tRNA ligase subunit beta [Anaerohalosphaeraceae bacterium]
MKISLEWLQEYVDLKGIRPEEIAKRLSDLGFPTESIEKIDGDTVIDIEITSNRGDCLSHIGIARELAAAYGKPLRLPDASIQESDSPVQNWVSVQIEESQLCSRYTARIITGVKVGPSPDWMVRRLQAAGMRSVNNVVDATNYAMLEHGQPPHAFDYDKIRGKKIIVRKARPGERLISIDGTDCQLQDWMLVIADAERPVAVGGVMGGLETEVTEQTATILLEEASFAPVSIRRTSRRLGLPSEASFRFERQVDTDNIDWASRRCAQLIVQVAGGQIARGVVDCYPGKTAASPVRMRLSRLKHLLGIEIPLENVLAIFSGLGLNPQRENSDVIVCTPPSWRHDLSREADLIEEAARCWGYEKVPVENKIRITAVPMDAREKVCQKIRTYLNGCGFFETINITFIDKQTAECFSPAPASEHLAVSDVSRKNTNLLRQNLIGSLLNTMQTNYHAGNIPCRLYEIADTFLPSREKQVLPLEKPKVALAADMEFQEMRGVLEGLLERLTYREARFQPAGAKWAQGGTEIFVGDRPVGFVGAVEDTIARRLDLDKGMVCAAELDLETLIELAADAKPSARPLPRFPAIRRDLSLILDEPVRWAEIEQAVRSAAPEELEEIRFGGLYRGKPIPAGKKSLTVSLRFRDDDGTLRHEQVDQFEAGILNVLKEKFRAELRTV